MRWFGSITNSVDTYFEQILGDSERQGSLVCCSPWSRKELDVIERLNNNNNVLINSSFEVETPILWPPDAKSQLIRKDPDVGKD